MNSASFRAARHSLIAALEAARVSALLIAGSVLVIGAAPLARADAQVGVAATATLRVLPVMAIRDVAPPVVSSRTSNGVEIAEQLTVASNADYVVHAMPSASMEALARTGVCVLALQPDGTYAPVVNGSRIPVARGKRGGSSTATVVFRFEGAGRLSARELARSVGLQLVVEGRDGGLYTTAAAVSSQ